MPSPSQVKPTLKFLHSTMKKSIRDFAKLHKNMMGPEASLQDAFCNQASLSIRVLLSHYVRCAKYANTWEVAERNYKGKDSLAEVHELVKKVVIVKKKDVVVARKKRASNDSSTTDKCTLQTLSAKAPAVAFWQVQVW